MMSPWKNKQVKAKFFDLCRELGEMDMWVRLHYVYPYPHVDEIFQLMAEQPDGSRKILPYLDIPFQHASPNVLKNMRRPANQEKVLDRVRKWRGGGAGPDAAIHLHRRLPRRVG